MSEKENEIGGNGNDGTGRRDEPESISDFLGPRTDITESRSGETDSEVRVGELSGYSEPDEGNVQTTDRVTGNEVSGTVTDNIKRVTSVTPISDQRRTNDVSDNQNSPRDSISNGESGTGNEVRASGDSASGVNDQAVEVNSLQSKFLSELQGISIEGDSFEPQVSITERPSLTIVRPNISSSVDDNGIKRISLSSSTPTPYQPGKTGKPGKGVDPKDVNTDFVSDSPLSVEERKVFTMAIQEISKYADEGLWYLGLDTLSDIPDKEFNPGVPIWELDNDEAKAVVDVLLYLGSKRPVIYKQMRVVNNLYRYLQVGLIGASRLFSTGRRLMETGINMRFSKQAYLESLARFNETAGKE